MKSKSFLLSNTIIFDAKPIAVPYNYRISYKIAQLVLILNLCCTSRSGCSFVKLHLISTALNSDSSIQNLIDFMEGNISEIPLVHFDPVVNRALLYALAEKIILQQKDGKFKLSPIGKSYVGAILKDTNIMIREKLLLSKLSTKVTENQVSEIMSNWRYLNAENQSYQN